MPFPANTPPFDGLVAAIHFKFFVTGLLFSCKKQDKKQEGTPDGGGSTLATRKAPLPALINFGKVPLAAKPPYIIIHVPAVVNNTIVALKF